MVYRTKTVSLGAVSILLAAALSGCGPTSTPSGSSQAAPTAGTGKNEPAKGPLPPLKITYLVQLGTTDVPQKDSEVEKAIEKYTNTELELQWTSDMKAKLPVLVASGDLPTAISFGNSQLQLPYMISAMRSDVFWDLTPYIKDYKNLKAIGDIRYQNTSLDGKNYGLPVVRPLSQNAITFRKDWLNNLGLKEPTTIDELYNVLKAFTTGDPDKNGKNDTYGIMDFKLAGLVNRFAPWFGVPNGWAVKDGKFVADIATPEFESMMKFLRKLYQEKILNQDFAVMEKTGWEAAFSSGKAGMIANVTNTAFKLSDKITKADPKAELSAFGRLPGAVDKTFATNGTNGIVVIPKSNVKTEAELRRVLEFFDKLGDEPMATLMKWGIEGKHFKMENGKAVYTDEKMYKTDVSPYRSLMAVDDKNAKPGEVPPLVALQEKMEAENEKVAVGNPTEPLLSATQSEKGGELNKLILDAEILFIMGKTDENSWQKTVDNWRKAGGDKIAEELAQEYAKLAKK